MIKSLLVIGCVFELVFAILADHLDPCPQHRGLPDGWRRADNLIDGRSLYRLDLRSAIRGYEPNKIYRLRVHTTSRRHKFNDASLMIDPLDPDCGIGRLIVDDDKHYSPKDCPDFVSTQQKEPMGRAHFKWEAPPCGCVHIRIRVHANSSYYIEDEYTSNGPLARTICPKADAIITTTEAVRIVERPSRADKLDELCKLSKDEPMSMLMKEKPFMEKRQLRFESEFEKERLAIALEQRQIETEKCCAYEGTHRVECFGDVRRRRIDQFCGTGEPDVPFTSSRYDWIKQKESECCWQIGEDRYHCFNYTHDLQRMINDGNNDVDRINSEDKDDFDPANFIDDYRSGEEDEEIMEKRTKSNKKQTNNEEYDREDNVDEEVGENDDDHDEKDDIIEDDHDKDSREKQEDLDRKKSHEESKLSEALIRKRKPLKPSKRLEKARKDQVKKGDDDEVDIDNEDDDDDYDDDYKKGYEEPPKPQGVDDRKLNPDICCFNGITAGTRVADKGVDGCFEMADRFNAIFSKWNKNCDRNFVVCCMRVVEGSSGMQTGQNMITKPTILSNELNQETVTYTQCLNIMLNELSLNSKPIDFESKIDDLAKGDFQTNIVNTRISKRKSQYLRQTMNIFLSKEVRTNTKSGFIRVDPSNDHKSRKLKIKLRRKLKENSIWKTNELFSSNPVIILRGKPFLHKNASAIGTISEANPSSQLLKRRHRRKLSLLSHGRHKQENETLKQS